MPIYTTTSLDYNNLHNQLVGSITTTTLLAEYILNSTSTYTITDCSGQIELHPIKTHERCVDEKDIDDTDSEELDKFLNGFKIKKREKTNNA